MEIIQLTNLGIISVFWLIMTAMYGLLGIELGYMSTLPVIDGADLSIVLIAFIGAIFSTVLFVMCMKGLYIE